MSLKNKNVLITGASMGIGAAIAKRLAHEQANLILFSRSKDKLESLMQDVHSQSGPDIQIHTAEVDIQDHISLTKAIEKAVTQLGPISILINNTGLALGCPSRFPDQSISDITTMLTTNVNGYLYTAHAALNQGQMLSLNAGTILNVTSVTGLEVPPFPGEAVYHTAKAAQEAFTNVLRTELVGTNICVLALRPGVVATNFHEQRVGYDSGMYEEFMRGFEPLLIEDVAEAVVWMVGTEERVSVKAVDVVPSAKRSLQVFDRQWNDRHKRN